MKIHETNATCPNCQKNGSMQQPLFIIEFRFSVKIKCIVCGYTQDLKKLAESDPKLPELTK